MFKYEFTDVQLNNLITFLDRSEVKGFREIQAMNEIMQALNNPVKEENKSQLMEE